MVLAEFLIFVPCHLCVLDWIISTGDHVKISSDGSCTAGVDIVEVSFWIRPSRFRYTMVAPANWSFNASVDEEEKKNFIKI